MRERDGKNALRARIKKCVRGGAKRCSRRHDIVKEDIGIGRIDRICCRESPAKILPASGSRKGGLRRSIAGTREDIGANLNSGMFRGPKRDCFGLIVAAGAKALARKGDRNENGLAKALLASQVKKILAKHFAKKPEGPPSPVIFRFVHECPDALVTKRKESRHNGLGAGNKHWLYKPCQQLLGNPAHHPFVDAGREKKIKERSEHRHVPQDSAC